MCYGGGCWRRFDLGILSRSRTESYWGSLKNYLEERNMTMSIQQVQRMRVGFSATMNAPTSDTGPLRNPSSTNCMARQGVCDSLQVTKGPGLLLNTIGSR